MVTQMKGNDFGGKTNLHGISVRYSSTNVYIYLPVYPDHVSEVIIALSIEMLWDILVCVVFVPTLGRIVTVVACSGHIDLEGWLRI